MSGVQTNPCTNPNIQINRQNIYPFQFRLLQSQCKYIDQHNVKLKICIYSLYGEKKSQSVFYKIFLSQIQRMEGAKRGSKNKTHGMQLDLSQNPPPQSIICTLTLMDE